MRERRKPSISLFGLVMFTFLLMNSSAHAAENKAGADTATFAGGCFWCMEPPFEGLDGVVSVTAGYTGGFKKNPTYEEVSLGTTGHAESVQIIYDPAKISYTKLLEIFWHNIDPTAKDRQFCDSGTQYRSAIFYHGGKQKKLAEESEQKVKELPQFRGKTIYTEIVHASTFYPAEEYHQGFYKKNPFRYKAYRLGCGRDSRLKDLWGDQAGGGH